MLGAVIGDIVGSRFEFDNYRYKDFELFSKECFFTDDTVMSLAIGKAIIETEKKIKIKDNAYYTLLEENAIKYMQSIGRLYPYCGYGGRFQGWMFDDHPKPYNSFGNGAAMRVSPVGFIAQSEEQVVKLSETVTKVTHNHPEGIKGAEAVSLAIYLARQGNSKEVIKKRIIKDYYPLNFTIDGIRETYQFNETCQDTVPQALVAFFESTSFEDALRIAVSVGGDSDTLAAITCSIAEVYYGIPEVMKEKAMTYLDEKLKNLYEEWLYFV